MSNPRGASTFSRFQPDRDSLKHTCLIGTSMPRIDSTHRNSAAFLRVALFDVLSTVQIRKFSLPFTRYVVLSQSVHCIDDAVSMRAPIFSTHSIRIYAFLTNSIVLHISICIPWYLRLIFAFFSNFTSKSIENQLTMNLPSFRAGHSAPQLMTM